MILLKYAQGIMIKVASNDHNWRIEDESNVELIGSNDLDYRLSVFHTDASVFFLLY
jgi:hypothetical protein